MGGIGGLLSGVALLGLLLLVLGIGLAVVAGWQGRPVRGGVLLTIIGLVVFALFSIVGNGILTVEPTQVAVVTNIISGQLEEPERRAGVSVLLPFIQNATLYDIRQKAYTMSATFDEGERQGDDAVTATTIDGQQVTVDVTINYAIDPNEANKIHLRWGASYETNFIRPTSRTVVRDVIATLPAEDIYGAERNAMQSKMEEEMSKVMAEEGFVITNFLVRGLEFGPEFAKAIEEKAIAEQRVAQAEREAEQARTRAQGEADAVVTRARGDANAAIERARGQAESLRLVSEQLAANPYLIQYEYIRNLSDNVRLITIPSNSPFLFDFSSFTDTGLMPDITIPTPESTPTTPGN